MFTEIETTPPLKAIDLFIGCDGWLTLDLYANPEDTRTANTFAIEPLTLVREYVRNHWDEGSNRIDNRESGCMIDLIADLKRCVSILEEAVYDDKHPDQ